MYRNINVMNALTKVDFFFFFLGLFSPPASVSAAGFSVSPLASASVTSPGTALVPRRPKRLLNLFSDRSFSFSSRGFARSTMAARDFSPTVNSVPFRASIAFWAASSVLPATKPYPAERKPVGDL